MPLVTGRAGRENLAAGHFHARTADFIADSIRHNSAILLGVGVGLATHCYAISKKEKPA